MFPLSNWTELDVWHYIHREQIPIVPLYFAAERPVVERDGTLIMVDDDRMPLEAGETPEHAMVRFRTLGCYPLTGAVESEADTLAAIIQEMLGHPDLGAPGPGDRPRRSRLDGEEEAGGLLLMSAPAEELVRPTSTRSSDEQEPAALHHLRQRRRRQEHADRPAALRVAAGLRRPARRAGGATRATVGTQGGELDFALLVDGLAAEREQGITIDVAYRFFSTERRKFIVADTPGHEQYTRNMVTGASTADCAVILIDARKGVLTQTRRHSYLVSLLGIRHIVLAVNKMDLVGFSEDRFREIEDDYRAFAAGIGLDRVTCIPISALRGDNILERGEQHCPGTTGPTLIEYLENVEVDHERMQTAPFRLPVQWVQPARTLDFRGFAGTIAGGTLRPGDRVRVLPSGRESTVERIVTYDGDLDVAVAGQSVTVTLADEIDVSRGDVLAGAGEPAGRGGPVRGHHRVDERGAAAARPLLPDAPRVAAGHGDGRAAQVQGQRQHAGAGGGDAAGAERDRRRATSSSTARSRSTPTRRTATPAASS